LKPLNLPHPPLHYGRSRSTTTARPRFESTGANFRIETTSPVVFRGICPARRMRVESVELTRHEDLVNSRLRDTLAEHLHTFRAGRSQLSSRRPGGPWTCATDVGTPSNDAWSAIPEGRCGAACADSRDEWMPAARAATRNGVPDDPVLDRGCRARPPAFVPGRGTLRVASTVVLAQAP